MVGIRSWSMEEIVWILDNIRLGWTVEGLHDELLVKFPHRAKKSSVSGIRYVWDKYKKDPSYVAYFLFPWLAGLLVPALTLLLAIRYNQIFSPEEIAFVLGWRHRPEQNDLQAILYYFEREFPAHVWSAHANKLLGIESVIARNQLEPKFYRYCGGWDDEEIRFILRANLRKESWETILEKFELRWPEKEVYLWSLQFLYARHRLLIQQCPRFIEYYKHDEWSPHYEEDQWCYFYQRLFKRGREGNEDDAEQSRSKRFHGSDDKSEESNSHGKCNAKNSTTRDKKGLSKLLEPHPPRASSSMPHGDRNLLSSWPRLQSSEAKVERAGRSSQLIYARYIPLNGVISSQTTNFNVNTSTKLAPPNKHINLPVSLASAAMPHSRGTTAQENRNQWGHYKHPRAATYGVPDNRNMYSTPIRRDLGGFACMTEAVTNCSFISPKNQRTILSDDSNPGVLPGYSDFAPVSNWPGPRPGPAIPAPFSFSNLLTREGQMLHPKSQASSTQTESMPGRDGDEARSGMPGDPLDVLKLRESKMLPEALPGRIAPTPEDYLQEADPAGIDNISNALEVKSQISYSVQDFSRVQQSSIEVDGWEAGALAMSNNDISSWWELEGAQLSNPGLDMSPKPGDMSPGLGEINT